MIWDDACLLRGKQTTTAITADIDMISPEKTHKYEHRHNNDAA